MPSPCMKIRLAKGKLYVGGIGPGYEEHMTPRAKHCIEESDVIVGYETYVALVAHLIKGKEVHAYAMTQEVERANQAIELAEKGRTVSLVSSGDAGLKHSIPSASPASGNYSFRFFNHEFFGFRKNKYKRENFLDNKYFFNRISIIRNRPE